MVKTIKSFTIFSAVYLLIVLFGQEEIAWYLKPFLLLLLLITVFTTQKFPSKNTLLVALAFSWLGDILLMFVSRNGNFFIFGLIAFLLSHITYIVLFTQQPKSSEQLALSLEPINKGSSLLMAQSSKLLRFGAGFIILYLCIMLKVLLPHLGAMRLPVTVYALVISTMLFFAFKGSLNWKKPAGNYVLLGALFFVMSDSILAFNKFYTPIPYNSFLIMSTYCIAQGLIVTGILKLNGAAPN